jgi:hypothetical protein
MKTKLKALSGLSQEELALLVHAWLTLLGVGIALRFLPLPQVQKLLNNPRRLRPSGGSLPFSRLAHLVGVAARHHVLPAHCLQKALILQSLLTRRGVKADLRIGVRREDGRLRAHAWVESAGMPLAESPDVAAHFLPLASVQGAS